MKKVIRLTESDLMRIVKRVINEQQQQSGDTYVSDVLKDYLDTDKQMYGAGELIKKANLGSTMSTNSGLKDFDIGASMIKTSGDPTVKKLLEDFQKMEKNNPQYQAYVNAIMKRMDGGTIVFQPYNGGRQVGEYGAKYIPSGPFSFKLISCTKQQPCRGTDGIK
jgi:hypothetical protein